MPQDSDYYGGGGEATAAADAGADRTPDDSAPARGKPDADDEKDQGAETASLPKSMFGDKEPAVGDVCQFKVEHIWEDEIEVSWVPEGTEQKPAARRSAMDEATDSFDQMSAGKSQM